MKKLNLNISWSKSVKAITVVATILIVICIIFVSKNLLHTSLDWLAISVIFILIFVYLLSVLTMPISINIDDDNLTIKKIIGSKTIPRAEIINVYPYQETTNIRAFGAGGVFGYVGLFWNKQERYYTSYVGNYDQAYYIIMESGKKYLISSKDRDLAISLLTEKV